MRKTIKQRLKRENKSEIEVFAASSSLEREKIIELARAHKFQVFDFSSIRSRFQIQLAYLHAEESFKDGKNITESIMLEWLLRASGKRQIRNAILEVGLKNPETMIIAFNSKDCRLKKEEILELLKAKEIELKESDDSTNIMEMVELEIEE